MKRRDFTNSLLAVLAAPTLPVRAFAAATTTQPMATGAAIAPPNLYTWSAMIARRNGACSAETLMKMLPVNATQANALLDRLITNNVVAPVNALGVRGVTSFKRPPPVTHGQVEIPDDAIDAVKEHDTLPQTNPASADAPDPDTTA